jgi:hypothetical protein
LHAPLGKQNINIDLRFLAHQSQRLKWAFSITWPEFAKLHMGLVILVKKMLVLINFLLQNTNLVSVLRKIPILCQSLEKSAQILLVMSDRTDTFRELCLASVVCHRLNFYITISFGWSSSKIVSGDLSQHPRSPPLRLKVERFWNQNFS